MAKTSIIEKRYQIYTSIGLRWSEWFKFCDGDSNTLKLIQANPEYKWQLKNKLLNEFRVSNN